MFAPFANVFRRRHRRKNDTRQRSSSQRLSLETLEKREMFSATV
jgi:hypothetical protein